MEKNWKNKKENECYFRRYMLKLSGGVKISLYIYFFMKYCDRHYLIITVDERPDRRQYIKWFYYLFFLTSMNIISSLPLPSIGFTPFIYLFKNI